MEFNRELEIQQIEQCTVINEMGCKLYAGHNMSGANKNTYAYKRIAYPSPDGLHMGPSINLGVHRHYYILKNGLLPCDLSIDDHISHYCHHKRCIVHISKESGTVNNNRNTCRIMKKCEGHHGLPNCIFQ